MGGRVSGSKTVTPNLTWSELKRILAAAGVRDSDIIVAIDIGPWTMHALKHTTVQDPDGLDIHIDTLADGSREVSIS